MKRNCCTEEKCEKVTASRTGMCPEHRDGRDPLLNSHLICKETGCNTKVRSDNIRGYCLFHRRTGGGQLEKRLARIRKRYRMTQGDYDKVVVSQGGCCPICTRPLLGILYDHIDHDHSCCPGETTCGNCVRGVLHGLCNRMLGTIETVRAMDTLNYDNYLDRWAGKTPSLQREG